MFDRVNTNSNSAPLSVQFPLSHANVHGEADVSLELAMTIAQGADERKADSIVLLDVEDVSYLADYFVIMTGFSKVQVRAIAGAIEQSVEERFGRSPLKVEGLSDGSWVLMDYGEVITHIFMPNEREFYGLEAFWGHAKKLAYSELNA